jgi:ATP-binding protein involved in chromosome partitioning
MIFKKNTAEKLFSEITLPIANISFKDALKTNLIAINESDDSITILLTFFLTKSVYDNFKTSMIEHLKKSAIKKNVSIHYQIHTRKTQPAVQPLKNIKNIIAVMAGKGGVGKSTVAVNLAAGLSAMGAKVGLLDADIYGPNQPQLCGVDLHTTDLAIQDNQFVPIEKHGFKHISMGYLIDHESAAIWRGPMATKALSQLCFQTQWGDLDYLVIDMPPGTGDIPLTLAQKIPVAGSVIVATPQALALSDIQKSMAMLEKLQIPILGIVENMGIFQCNHCGQTQSVFSQNHSAELCKKFGKPLLAQIPLHTDIDQSSENGEPIVLSKNNSMAEIFMTMASQISFAMASQPRDYSVHFPKVVVE